MDYRIKGHTPLGVSFSVPLPPTLLNLVTLFREITPGSMLNLLISRKADHPCTATGSGIKPNRINVNLSLGLDLIYTNNSRTKWSKITHFETKVKLPLNSL